MGIDDYFWIERDDVPLLQNGTKDIRTSINSIHCLGSFIRLIYATHIKVLTDNFKELLLFEKVWETG